MNRKMLLIANPGPPDDPEHYCEGVNVDVQAYLDFFHSPLGGSWYEFEIKVLKYPSCAEVRSALTELRRADYSMIVFCGHGYSNQYDETILELSKDEELPASELRGPCAKRSIILDCCRKKWAPIKEPLIGSPEPLSFLTPRGFPRLRPAVSMRKRLPPQTADWWSCMPAPWERLPVTTARKVVITATLCAVPLWNGRISTILTRMLLMLPPSIPGPPYMWAACPLITSTPKLKNPELGAPCFPLLSPAENKIVYHSKRGDAEIRIPLFIHPVTFLRNCQI